MYMYINKRIREKCKHDVDVQNGVLHDVAPVIEDGVMDTSVIIIPKIEIQFTVWYSTCIHV